jgi:membrane-associated phospholipid phosphatase
MAGVPDKLGIIAAPALSFGYYIADTVTWAARGRGFGGDLNPDHELLALVEAFGATLLVNEPAKLLTARLRPEYALGHITRDQSTEDNEATLSFFSRHASFSFCVAAFASRDFGDWLAAAPLADSSPARRLWLGRVLPGAVLYGAAAWVAVSRVVDQKHYLSDVLVGAAVGGFAGNWAYARHFDLDGRPRRRKLALNLVPLPGGLAIAGRM